MPDTLANLTLRMSREISKLEARCAREQALAERERDDAFHGLEQAKRILVKYYQGLEKAKQVQLREVQAGDEARDREIQAAENKRREQTLREERKHRQARAKALSKRNETVRKAKRKWNDAVRNARRRALSDQRRARQAADETLEHALEDSRQQYLGDVEGARLAHQSALQDRLVEERLAVGDANRKAERIITGAAIGYERAVAQEESRMRRALSDYPEAWAAQERHDRRIAGIREACEQAKEALFAKFTRDRRGLKR